MPRTILLTSMISLLLAAAACGGETADHDAPEAQDTIVVPPGAQVEAVDRTRPIDRASAPVRCRLPLALPTPQNLSDRSTAYFDLGTGCPTDRGDFGVFFANSHAGSYVGLYGGTFLSDNGQPNPFPLMDFSWTEVTTVRGRTDGGRGFVLAFRWYPTQIEAISFD
jgi:hypothetical protein